MSSFSPYQLASVISLTSLVHLLVCTRLAIYIKPREHGDCMFRNEWLPVNKFNFKPWPGTLGTCTLALPWDNDVK